MVSRRKFIAGATATSIIAPSVVGWNGVTASAQDAIEIAMWFDVTGGAETANCIVEHVVEPFNEQSGSVTVEATMQANGWNATRTALAGGGGPDIVTTPGPTWNLELANAGQIAPMNAFAEQFGWEQSFVPWALEAVMHLLDWMHGSFRPPQTLSIRRLR